MRNFALLAILFALPARAEDLQYLDHSELALARLYQDIASAESTIDLTYLIWDPCSTAGKVLLKKLREKAKPARTAANPNPKPVKVRMLLDPFFQKKNLHEMASYFAESGIDLKFYNAQNPFANTHTHSKLTLVDKKLPGKARMVTGGRNVGDEYFGLARNNYVDRDVAVTGPSSTENRAGPIGEADASFERLWGNSLSTRVSPASANDLAEFKNKCAKWTPKEAKLERYLQEQGRRIVSEERAVSCENVKFTMDDMSHKNAQGTPFKVASKPTSRAVLDLVGGAKRTLTMENQYYIPDDTYMKDTLRRQKANGVKIDLYSNMFDNDAGFETVFSPKFEIVAGWQRHYMRDDNGGNQRNHMNFRIAGMMDKWAFSPPETAYTYHAKTFVADGKDAIVSSFNVDPRSMSINGESALVAKNCPAFAKKVEDVTKLTGKVWTQEENLQLCLGGTRPNPPGMGPISSLLAFFSKELQ